MIDGFSKSFKIQTITVNSVSLYVNSAGPTNYEVSELLFALSFFVFIGTLTVAKTIIRGKKEAPWIHCYKFKTEKKCICDNSFPKSIGP